MPVSTSRRLLACLLTAAAIGWTADAGRPAAGISEVYVSPSGNDANPGTKEKPLKSPAAGQRAARKLSAGGPVRVWFRGGTYYLAEPLTMGPKDSGATYSAYPGEIPVLSGAVKLPCGWKQFRGGILACSVPRGLQFTQLFVNGKRQIRARYPNFDPANPVKGGYADVLESLPGGRQGVRFAADRFSGKHWARPEEGIVHLFPTTYYGNLQWKVVGIDWSQSAIRFGDGGFQLRAGARVGKGSRFYVENLFEELDSPGEWYLDSRAAVLYYLPPANFDPAHAALEAPVLEQVLELRGDQRNPVRKVTISGFRITGTRSTFLDLYEGAPSGDWTIHRGGAVFLDGTEDCSIERCFFDAVGGNAVFVNNYNRRAKIQGNRITGAGESAVCLMGAREFTYGSNEPYPSESLVSNNLIHDCGVFGKQVAGVFVSTSRANTISHNHIFHMPRAAINVNDGWSVGQVIEFNRIHDTVLETRDHGPFNSWGRDLAEHPRAINKDPANTVVIRNNWFKDDHGWGIDLDDVTSNYRVNNNVCIGMSVKLRQGYFRTVENNIFVNPANPPGFHAGYDDNGDRFVRNIVITNSKVNVPEVDAVFHVGEAHGASYQLIWPPEKRPWLQEIDYNLLFNDIGRFQASVRIKGTLLSSDSVNNYGLDEWRGLGFDRHSIFADPLFVDPATGDYRLKPDSPALRLGFQSFDIRQAGLQPDFPVQWKDENLK